MGKTRKIQNSLLDDERMLFAASMHWAIFLFPMILVVVAGLVWHFFHPLVGGTILFFAIFPIVNAAILYSTTEYGVTNKRVVAYYGLFTTDLMQIGHDRLESAHVEQSFIGQILGYYTVSTRGTGTGSIPIPFLDDGDKLKRILDEILYADTREGGVQKIEQKFGIDTKKASKQASKKGKKKKAK